MIQAKNLMCTFVGSSQEWDEARRWFNERGETRLAAAIHTGIYNPSTRRYQGGRALRFRGGSVAKVQAYIASLEAQDDGT